MVVVLVVVRSLVPVVRLPPAVADQLVVVVVVELPLVVAGLLLVVVVVVEAQGLLPR